MSVAERLAAVQSQVSAACHAAGRDPADVGLIAVSKHVPVAAIAEAAASGHCDFGESYAQELRDKAALHPTLRWHFIGRLQRNKAKYVAPVAARIHALETVAQAEAMLTRAPGPLHALVSVNLGGQESKGGVTAQEALDRCAVLHALPGLAVVGLMTMPPPSEDPEDAAPYFEELADLAARGRARGLPLDELSMGMSADFAVAIRFGATWVRVGTAIFGPRIRTRSRPPP